MEISVLVSQSAVWFVKLLQSLLFFTSFNLLPFALFPPSCFAPPVSDSSSTRSHPPVSVWTFLHLWCSLHALQVCLSNVSTTPHMRDSLLQG